MESTSEGELAESRRDTEENPIISRPYASQAQLDACGGEDMETGEDQDRSGAARDKSPEGEHARPSVDHVKANLPITLKMLSQGGYYDMPMSKVAHLLGRTEGSFQRVCRALGIVRWPYRVRKSLQAIMEKTEQYLDDEAEEDGMSKAEVLSVLRGHMNDIKGISGSGMDKATKQYRQYIFKVNHKLSRKAAKVGDTPAGDNHKVRGMLRAASKIQKPGRRCKIGELDMPDSLREAGSCMSGALPTQPSSGSSLTAGLPGSGSHAYPRVCKPSAELPSCKSLAKTPNSSRVGGEATRSAGPMRPTPRHFRDLPASLAFEPVGQEKAGPANIVGRMATSAAVQNRMRFGTAMPEDYRQLCRKEDAELLQLCLEMDAHLDAAQKAMAGYNFGFRPPKQYSPWAKPNLLIPQYSSSPLGAPMHPFSTSITSLPLLPNCWAVNQNREV